MTVKHRVWHALLPDLPRVSLREQARSALGALLGILATGLVSKAALGSGSALPVMVAPMGASAVLLFAVPSSPLAQPWSILGGNAVASLVGVTAVLLIPNPFAAAAVAVGLAIALMISLRCLHPPSGAVALTAVLGGPAITNLGYGFVLWPVGANSVLLLAVALLFNNLTGRRYPHVVPREDKAADESPGADLTAADLDAAIEDFDALFEIGRGDLRAILRRAHLQAALRRSGPATCASVMTAPPRAVAPDTPLRLALALMRAQSATMLPVTDERARLLGLVSAAEVVDHVAWDGSGARLGLRQRTRLTLAKGRAPHGCVADVMTADPAVPTPETPVGEALLAMTRAGLQHVPVVDADGRMVGIVAQADLLAEMLADFGNPGEAPPQEGPALLAATGS